MSLRRAMEAMPGVSDVAEELRTIELEAIDQAGMVMFQQLAAAGQLDLTLWSTIRDEMAKKGMPLYKAINKYQEMIAEQAAAAQGTDIGALTAPEAPVEESELPGVPAEALGGV